MGPNSNPRTEGLGYYRGEQLNFIQPRKTVENAFIVSLYGRLPKKCLNVHQLASLDKAQAILETRRMETNPHRPHRSRGRLTPSKFISQRQGSLQPLPCQIQTTIFSHNYDRTPAVTV
jgi:hypothetical protein